MRLDELPAAMLKASEANAAKAEVRMLADGLDPDTVADAVAYMRATNRRIAEQMRESLPALRAASHDPVAVQAIIDGLRLGAYDEPPSGAHQVH